VPNLSEQADMNDGTERWRPVAGYEDLYHVSDLGRVWALPRWIRGRSGSTWLRPGRFLTPSPTSNGYLKVTLSDSRGGQERRAVHRLVAETFLGPCPPGEQVRHGPGGKLDNRLVNLCYGTKAQDSADKLRDGTHVHGSGSVNAKLTEDIVRECRRRYATGDGTTVSLAAEFGVSQMAMWKAVHRKTWKYVT
jgi:hypothetical protein